MVGSTHLVFTVYISIKYLTLEVLYVLLQFSDSTRHFLVKTDYSYLKYLTSEVLFAFVSMFRCYSTPFLVSTDYM